MGVAGSRDEHSVLGHLCELGRGEADRAVERLGALDPNSSFTRRRLQ